MASQGLLLLYNCYSIYSKVSQNETYPSAKQHSSSETDVCCNKVVAKQHVDVETKRCMFVE